MKEIDQLYGKEQPRKVSAKKSKPAAREEVKQESFDGGFDHGFESMATFNGKTVGTDSGP